MWPIWDRIKHSRFRRKTLNDIVTLGMPESRCGYNMKIDIEKIKWECVY